MRKTQRQPGLRLYDIINDAIDHFITYQQHILDDYSILLSNFDTDAKKIKINNYEGVYTIYFHDGVVNSNIVWNDKRYTYKIYGNVDLDTLISIAESIS